MSERYHKPLAKSSSLSNSYRPPHYSRSVMTSGSYLAKLKEKKRILLSLSLSKSKLPVSKKIPKRSQNFSEDYSCISVRKEISLLLPIQEEVLNVLRIKQPRAEIKIPPVPHSKNSIISSRSLRKLEELRKF